MTPVSEASTIDLAVAAVRRGASSYITNFYPNRARLQAWVAEGRIFLLWQGSSVLLWRQDDGFGHLYFAAANMDCLRATLEQIHPILRESTIVDLIGSETGVTDVMEIFAARGFVRRACLRRMGARLPLRISPVQIAVRTEQAEMGDASWIRQSLLLDFERLVDQIPTEGEMLGYVTQGRVLVARFDGRAAGFLIHEINGATAIVKYWYVSNGFRGKGVGAELLRCFSDFSANATRCLLWVKEDNKAAIARYFQYGFTWEGLVDRVLCFERFSP
jgi:ribosomal protein S18 acetylase RimI-like enzyme